MNIKLYLLFLSILCLCSSCLLQESKVQLSSKQEIIGEDDSQVSSTQLTNDSEDNTSQESKGPNFQKVIDQIGNDILKGLPGAVVYVSVENSPIYFEAFGYSQLYDKSSILDFPIPMTTLTSFDLASLTKALSTTIAIMQLESTQQLTSEAFLYNYLNGYSTLDFEQIKIEHLLTHTSGLMASYPFYRGTKEFDEDFLSRSRALTYEYIPLLPLSYPTEEKDDYSDLGFIELGHIIEVVTGKPLDVYTKENIFLPLGLDSITYTPNLNFDYPYEIAATERFGNTRDKNYTFDSIRDYTLIGEVHDELAYYSMEGISGHAGLFGNAMDIGTLANELLRILKLPSENNDELQNPLNISRKVLEKYTRQSTYATRYCLGFDYAMDHQNINRYGQYVSDQAFGKTGWTGTLLLIDPAYDLVIVLLTNKRHSPYDNGTFEGARTETGGYRRIVDLIYEDLLESHTILKN